MPVPTNNDNAKEIGDVKQRLAIVEQQQKALEDRYQRLQKESDEQSEDLKNEYLTKREFELQMQNISLTINLLRQTVDLLSVKIGTVETVIVAKVESVGKKAEDVAKAQQEGQTSFLRRTIVVQATVLFLILGAFLAVAIPFLLSLHH